MNEKKAKFKIFGKPLSFERDGRLTVIRWSSMNVLDIILIFVVAIMGLWGIGSALNWEEMNGLRILPMNPTQTVFFWSVAVLILVHLLFNCTAQLSIDKHEISFQKRRLIPIIYKHAVRNIDAVYVKESRNYYENDVGYYPIIYKVYIQLLDGRTRKLGSFNKENTEALKNEIQEYMTMNN